MPNCFQLICKKTNEPARLQSVDDEIWRFFNEEPDPNQWCLGWYNVIGFGIAMGKLKLSDKENGEKYITDWFSDDLSTSDDKLRCQRMLQVLTYLRENYESDAFVAAIGI
jgi:hypothetical protein